MHSARSVNHHLKITNKDIWLVSLPLFHVGGLSILARSFLSQSQCFILKERWSPNSFLSSLQKNQVTVTSLTPTQVYDLVIQQAKAPSHLRAVVVGGGVLHENLYKTARRLKWPLLPSYGLTELCSQVATAQWDSLQSNLYPSLQILEHCKVKITEKGYIAIQSDSLLTGWFLKSVKSNIQRGVKSIENPSANIINEDWVFSSPVKEQWLVTEDQGRLDGKYLKIWGRDQMVKIRGENVSLFELNNILEKNPDRSKM